MGLHDRDWYQEEHDRRRHAPIGNPFRPPSDGIHPMWIAAAIVGAIDFGYWLFGGASVLRAPTSSAPAQPRVSADPAPVLVVPRDLSSRVVVETRPVAPPPAPMRPEQIEPEAPPPTRTVYLCKGYGGGMFWSSATCSTQRATIDRMHTVPGHLSWPEQVAYVEREWQQARQLSGPATGGGANGIAPSAAGSPACEALAAQIDLIDAEARRPNSAWRQDQLRQERITVRSRMAELRC